MNLKDFKKRAGSFGLAALMSLSMAVPAFAASDPTKEVKGTYAGASTGTPVYSYSYNFGSMEFTYKAPGTDKGTWDPKTHTYSGGGGTSEGGWSCAKGANDITVINHSNAPVQVRLSFEAAKDGFLGGFSKNNFTIASADGTITLHVTGA